MTAAFFDYPKAAAFGRVVPKSRIYEHAGVGTALTRPACSRCPPAAAASARSNCW